MKALSVNPSTKGIVLLAVIAALLLCTGVMSYVVCSRNLRAANEELQEKQNQVDDSKKIAKRLADAENNYLHTQKELGFLETSVSTHAYVPTLLKQLEHLGESLDMKVLSVRPQAVPAAPRPVRRASDDADGGPGRTDKADEEEKKQAYDELRIDVELEGTYWQTRDLIHRFTEFPKIIAVRQVQMTPVGNSTDARKSPDLNVRLSVLAFVFPEAEPGPVLEQQAPPEVQTTQAAPDRRASNEG